MLAELDQKLAATYKKAELTADGKSLTTLKATQRGWIKGRNVRHLYGVYAEGI